MNKATFKPSFYNHLVKYNSDGDYILYNAISRAMIFIKKESAPDIKKILKKKSINRLKDSPSDIIENLITGKFLIPLNQNEFNKLKLGMFKTRFNPLKQLKFILAPTTQCNFRCVYCFQNDDIKIDNQKMTTEVQDQLVRILESKINHIPRLFVQWLGGEPLLGMDIIESLSDRFRKICNENNVPYYSLVTTNGYLANKKMVDRLINCGVKEMMVTLDGDKDAHDKVRILKNGAGSFDKIIENLSIITEKMPVVLRLNIDKNIDKTYRLISLLKDKPYAKKLLIYLADLHEAEDLNRTSGCTDCASDIYLSKDPEKLAQVILKLNQRLEEAGLKNNKKYSSLEPKLLSCTAQDINGYIIDPAGNRYSCLRDIGNDELIIGNILADSNDELTFNKQYARDYLMYDPFLNKECQTCKVLPLCLAGCPKRAFDLNRVDCRPIKYHINDIILKEAKKKLQNFY